MASLPHGDSWLLPDQPGGVWVLAPIQGPLGTSFSIGTHNCPGQGGMTGRKALPLGFLDPHSAPWRAPWTKIQSQPSQWDRGSSGSLWASWKGRQGELFLDS